MKAPIIDAPMQPWIDPPLNAMAWQLTTKGVAQHRTRAQGRDQMPSLGFTAAAASTYNRPRQRLSAACCLLRLCSCSSGRARPLEARSANVQMSEVNTRFT
jgi:hypothetical protein